MLRRLKVLLILFVLLLMLDRWMRRDDQLAGETDYDSEWRPGKGGAQGDSIVLEKDAPIIVAEEASLARMEDTPAAAAEAAGLETVSPAGDQAPVESGTGAGLPTAEIPSPAGVFAEGAPPEAAQSAAETAPEAAGQAKDDLTMIEGIGSRITELLYEAGIRTFEQLGSTEPDRVREILQQAGLRMIDPSTWSEQARLAARDDWESLKELQGQLKAGRRE